MQKDYQEREISMITTEQIARHFDSLSDFENFRLRWIRSCAAINKNGRNADVLEKMEKRAEKLGL